MGKLDLERSNYKYNKVRKSGAYMITCIFYSVFWITLLIHDSKENNQAADYFQIDSSTGILTVGKRIDLESPHISNLGGLLEFQIVAYEVNDENSRTLTQVTVAIVDLNDNIPEFASASYDLQISPDSVEGTSLTLMADSIHVFDLDKGINGSFSLFLVRDYNISEDFEVIPKVALNDANLVVKLKRSDKLMAKMGIVEHYQVCFL